MFDGMTGVFEICNSVVAAATSLCTPFLMRRFTYRTSMIICAVATVLSYLFCALPEPMSTAKKVNEAGPVIGTMISGFMHAFGVASIIALQAFFPQEAPLALSAGSGLAVIVGPGSLIGLLAAFGQSAWRRVLLVYMPTGPLIMVVWWLLMEQKYIDAAEASRTAARKAGSKDGEESKSTESDGDSTPPSTESDTQDTTTRPAVQQRSRMDLLFKMVLPQYLLAFLLICVAANLATMGVAPSLQKLKRFKDAPKGDLQFELICKCFFPMRSDHVSKLTSAPVLASGVGNFLFATLAGIRPSRGVWIWTALQTLLCIVGVIQLWAPFLTYYAFWVEVMFFIGGIVGVGRTNCFFSLSEDFRGEEYDEATRSFMVSFAGTGNFLGDGVGGCFAVLTEKLATKALVATIR